MTFLITPEQDERVRRARGAFLAEYGFEPDLAALRSFVMGGFAGDIIAMDKFWTSLTDDMPRTDELTGLALQQAQEAWREKKLAAIVEAHGGSLVTWESRTIHACLTSPNSLAQAAEGLQRAQDEGFVRHGHEIADIDGDTPLMSWFLRRKKG